MVEEPTGNVADLNQFVEEIDSILVSAVNRPEDQRSIVGDPLVWCDACLTPSNESSAQLAGVFVGRSAEFEGVTVWFAGDPLVVGDSVVSHLNAGAQGSSQFG